MKLICDFMKFLLKSVERYARIHSVCNNYTWEFELTNQANRFEAKWSPIFKGEQEWT